MLERNEHHPVSYTHLKEGNGSYLIFNNVPRKALLKLSHCSKNTQEHHRIFLYEDGKVCLLYTSCIVALPILWLTHCRSAWIAVLAIISYSIYCRFSISFRWDILTLITISLLSCCLLYTSVRSTSTRTFTKPVTGEIACICIRSLKANYTRIQT